MEDHLRRVRRLEAAAAAGQHYELLEAAIALASGSSTPHPCTTAERLLCDALDGHRGQVVIADKV